MNPNNYGRGAASSFPNGPTSLPSSSAVGQQQHFSLPSEVEELFQRYFYASRPHPVVGEQSSHSATTVVDAAGSFVSAAQVARRYGLLCPLWLWTHYSTNVHASDNDSSAVSKCLTKAANLVQWLQRNQTDLHRVAIVVDEEHVLAMQEHLTVHSPISAHPSTSHDQGQDKKEESKAELPQQPEQQQQHREGSPSSHSSSHRRGSSPFPGAVQVTTPRRLLVARRAQLANRDRADSPSSPSSTTVANHASVSRCPQYDVVLWLHTKPQSCAYRTGPTLLKEMESECAAVVHAAKYSLICISDAAWLSSALTKSWSAWSVTMGKFADEQWTDELIDIQKGFYGAKLPVCCGEHPRQRSMVSGLIPIVVGGPKDQGAVCARACLRPLQCQQPYHLCSGPCHPAHVHRSCPYACQEVLPCGHTCRMLCGERHNCLHVIQTPLPCSHQIVIGLDRESLLPIYADVAHQFHGYCCDQDQPCAVRVPTRCALCFGSFDEFCHVLTAAGHTLENRLLSCPDCLTLQRELRLAAVAEVLVKAAEKKRTLQVSLAKSLHDQRKAASSGLFELGARVVIRDVSKLIAPMESDFPGIAFVDDTAESFYRDMQDQHGTFLSRHVDIDDLTEVRSLVRLPSGKHVLVADGGLQLIRATTANIVGMPAATNVLLLTGPSSSSATTEGANPNEGQEEDSKTPEVDYQTFIGKWFYFNGTARLLSNSDTTSTSSKKKTDVSETPLDSAGVSEHDEESDVDDEALMVSDVVVRVTGKGDRKNTVFVECHIFNASQQPQQAPAAAAEELHHTGDDGNEPNRKKHRFECDDRRPSSAAVTVADSRGMTLVRLMVPVSQLEPLANLTNNASSSCITLLDSGSLVRHAETLQILKAALAAQLGPEAYHGARYDQTVVIAPPFSSHTTATGGVAAPQQQQQYRVVLFVNAPKIDPESPLVTLHGVRLRGPYCLLESRSSATTTAAAPTRGLPTRQGGRPVRSSSSVAARTPPAASPTAPATTSSKYYFVPLPYVAVDELSDALSQLDDDALRQVDALVAERMTQRTEDRAFRNDEHQYHQQCQMPVVTAEVRAEVARRPPLESIPTPLPSRVELAHLETRAAKAPIADASSMKLAKTKEQAQEKLESIRARQFQTNVFQVSVEEDQKALQPYLLAVQKRVEVAMQHRK